MFNVSIKMSLLVIIYVLENENVIILQLRYEIITVKKQGVEKKLIKYTRRYDLRKIP